MKFYIGQNSGRHYEALLKTTVIDDENKRLSMHLECYQVTGPDGEKVESETKKSYPRKLQADNTVLVDSNGDYLPEGATEGIGEWDLFSNISANVSVKVDELKLNTLIKNRHRLMPDDLLPENV